MSFLTITPLPDSYLIRHFPFPDLARVAVRGPSLGPLSLSAVLLTQTRGESLPTTYTLQSNLGGLERIKG